MNCPACGHELKHHTPHFEEGGCYTEDCMCMLSSIEIERNVYKAEAQAARELLENSLAIVYQTGFRTYLEGERLWQAYLAARVPDDPKETP